MDVLTQQLINGLVLGSVYALVALGYTLVYGILELINFAHGEVTMSGAMIGLATIAGLSGLGLPAAALLLAGLLAAVAGCVLLGLAIERICYRPLRRAPRLSVLITAIGVSIVLQNAVMLLTSRQYLAFPPLLPQTRYEVLGASVSFTQLLILLLSAALMAGLVLLVRGTRLGRAMRATAQAPDIARLMGVNTHGVIAATFAIGSGLAAVAGVMVGAYYGQAHYGMGFLLGLKAFSAAVLGGIGNLTGAMLGGLLLGVIEALGAGYIGPLTGGVLGSHYQDIFAFLVLIAVLVLRPSGLLGQHTTERA